jgi:hypothetical protein
MLRIFSPHHAMFNPHTTPYFFFGLFFAAFGFAVVFGRGAFGFFVGTLATFFAFDGDFLAFAGAARFFSAVFTAAFFWSLGFLQF